MSDIPIPDANATVIQRLGDILTDIKTLLDYLGRLDNGRLQAHFDDTRAAVTEAVQFRAVPPCRTYAAFLARLAWLGTSITMGRWPADPMPDSSIAAAMPPATPGAQGRQNEVTEPLGDIPFLVWSRDFLAAVAAPATVESIEVTRAYVQTRIRRSHSGWIWRRRGKPSVSRGDIGKPLTAPPAALAISDAQRTGRLLHGAMLATAVRWLEAKALIATVAALIVSTYALSGQTILDQKQTVAASYTRLSQDIEAIIESMIPIEPTVDGSLAMPASCGMAQAKPQHVRPADFVSVAPIVGLKMAAESPAQTAQIHSMTRLRFYCDQKEHAEAMLGATAVSLQSWVQLIAGPYDIAIFSHDVSLPGLGQLFGDARRSGSTAAADMLEQSGGVAKPILSAVTLYVMPCLYGLIGAAAATLRMLRRKIDASTLTYTDRGRVRQDVLLGVMCGATIGLFAGYILGANPTQGLGLSALALLAGYNVAGVFTFLDELSARLFRPVDTTSAKG